MNVTRIKEQYELIHIFNEDGQSPITVAKAKRRLVKSILTHLWDCPTEECGVAYEYLGIESDMINALATREINMTTIARAVNFLMVTHS